MRPDNKLWKWLMSLCISSCHHCWLKCLWLRGHFECCYCSQYTKTSLLWNQVTPRAFFILHPHITMKQLLKKKEEKRNKSKKTNKKWALRKHSLNNKQKQINCETVQFIEIVGWKVSDSLMISTCSWEMTCVVTGCAKETFSKHVGKLKMTWFSSFKNAGI